MPRVPAVAEESVCEINREFFTGQSEDVGALQEQYGKILGRVFPKLQFKVPETESGELAAIQETASQETLENVFLRPLSLLQKLRSRITGDRDVTPAKLLQSVSWHKQRLYLAFVANAKQVLVVDYDEPPQVKPCILSHDVQQNEAESVEWRPNSGSTLAVGCRGGVCIWTASYPGSMPPVRLGSVPLVGSPTRAGTKWSLIDFLPWDTDASVSALSWSPCGTLLACGSTASPTFMLWDVSLGESTPLRRGITGIQYLRWSPKGDYLFVAQVDGSFYFWETQTWTADQWNSAGGAVVGAAWNPDGRMLLSAFDKMTTLGTLHFAGKPPSLEVHMLPLELPDVEGMAGPGGGIEKLAWDGTGERLAVSYTDGDARYSGLIAVYDTRKSPIISASLLGFIRGPGEGAKPLAFAFHDKLRQGALLGVIWSTGFINVYPLLFRTH